MLTTIHIRDFAIVDQLELELQSGMTALTGETGAGKSILVDALGMALGDRADSDTVRHGAERAEISAAFELQPDDGAWRWLEEQELSADGECVLRRVISAEGRSRAYINGRPVPVQSLRELGEHLVDIHGQHEHQSLLKRDTQRQLLDDFAGNGALLQELGDAFRTWDERRREFETLRSAAADRTERVDLLAYQVQELETLNLASGEADAVEAEHKRLANAGQLLETVQSLLQTLYESEDISAQDQLSRCASELEALCALDEGLEPARELLNGALIQLREGVDELRAYGERLDLDPGRLQWLDERIGAIHRLSRKHRVSADELPDLLERLRSELHGLADADERLDALQGEIDAARADYDRLAQQLGQRRRDAARQLNTKVTHVIQQLGMEDAAFEIRLESPAAALPNPLGLEQVEFQVRTNAGQPLKALSRVASGGELSRFSLAIQVVLARDTRIATLIYDEVDTGIGGAVAEVVGRQLRTLGEGRQVLCVTHLPQVAAQAHRHLQVEKSSSERTTRTAIRPLDESQRLEEIARMLGGVEISDQTRAHAREMIGGAQSSAQPANGKPRKPRAGKRRASNT